MLYFALKWNVAMCYKINAKCYNFNFLKWNNLQGNIENTTKKIQKAYWFLEKRPKVVRKIGKNRVISEKCPFWKVQNAHAYPWCLAKHEIERVQGSQHGVNDNRLLCISMSFPGCTISHRHIHERCHPASEDVCWTIGSKPWQRSADAVG